MRSFKASEAKRQFYRILELADTEGGVHVQHRDGRRYLLTSEGRRDREMPFVTPSGSLSMRDVVSVWQDTGKK